MLVLLRILFGAALVYELMQGAAAAPNANDAGDLTGAFYLAVCVGLGLLNAVVWAPYLGAKVSGPLTGIITESTYVERTNCVLRLIRWLEARGYRRALVCCCFLECVRHPAARWKERRTSGCAVGVRTNRPDRRPAASSIG